MANERRGEEDGNVFSPENVKEEFEKHTKNPAFHESLDEEVSKKKKIDIVEALQPMDI